MPTVLSGPRFARSMLSPSGTAVLTKVLDFNLAADEGIEITSVMGNMHATDLSPPPSDTTLAHVQVAQSLHLEEGTIEDIPFVAGEDGDQIDTEVFFLQEAGSGFIVGTTNTFGAGGDSPQSSLYVPYRDPVLAARNITHRAETVIAGVEGICSVLIAYRYVKFSLGELGLLLARRQ